MKPHDQSKAEALLDWTDEATATEWGKTKSKKPWIDFLFQCFSKGEGINRRQLHAIADRLPADNKCTLLSFAGAYLSIVAHDDTAAKRYFREAIATGARLAPGYDLSKSLLSSIETSSKKKRITPFIYV